MSGLYLLIFISWSMLGLSSPTPASPLCMITTVPQCFLQLFQTLCNPITAAAPVWCLHHRRVLQRERKHLKVCGKLIFFFFFHLFSYFLCPPRVRKLCCPVRSSRDHEVASGEEEEENFCWRLPPRDRLDTHRDI